MFGPGESPWRVVLALAATTVVLFLLQRSDDSARGERRGVQIRASAAPLRVAARRSDARGALERAGAAHFSLTFPTRRFRHAPVSEPAAAGDDFEQAHAIPHALNSQAAKMSWRQAAMPPGPFPKRPTPEELRKFEREHAERLRQQQQQQQQQQQPQQQQQQPQQQQREEQQQAMPMQMPVQMQQRAQVPQQMAQAASRRAAPRAAADDGGDDGDDGGGGEAKGPGLPPLDASKLPADVAAVLRARDEAETRFNGFYTMGEPGLTFDRIDRSHAEKGGLSVAAFQLRRKLWELRQRHGLADGTEDEAVRSALRAELARLPSEADVGMMADPGGWASAARLYRKAVALLARDAAARRQFMAEGAGKPFFEQLAQRLTA
jgi:hypothetical protein